MKKPIDLKSLMLGAMLGAAIVFSVAATTNSGARVWEYKVVPGDVFPGQDQLDKAINATVTNGWDFVSALEFGKSRRGSLLDFDQLTTTSVAVGHFALAFFHAARGWMAAARSK